MKKQMLNDIKNCLRNLGGKTSLTRNSTDKIYEIYIYACVIESLKKIHANLEIRDKNDDPTSNLIFRLKPGLIYSPSNSSGFIYVEYKSRNYEIQCGLRVSGVSKVLHELDVCIIKRHEAERSRNNRRNPMQNSIIFLAECKYYGSTLPLKIGREYLGLCKEFGARIKSIVSNVESENIHNLVTRHREKENFNISLSEPDNVNTFINWLANELRQIM